MELEFDQPNVKLRNSRTPKNIEVDPAVRESLLSDSTSGIVKGEGDDLTSVGSSSFSSPDLDEKRERILTVVSKNDINYNKCDKPKEEEKFLKEEVKIITNPVNDFKHVDSKKNDSEVENDDHDDKVAIPDGGWGWVVVLSSFIISMIADGISFSFGLLYIEFLEEFQASKASTAWIGSLFIAVPLLSGPVMCALVDRYGCRSMTILGGIISTIGFVLASVSTTIEMMMITFGVIAGLGLGLVYVTAVVAIAYWFEKKRNLAVGLGACGTGFGTFVYAKLTQYFIKEYGWRGTILLLAGTLLNLCVCGCVMRDPQWWIQEQKKQKKIDGKLKKEDEKYTSTCSISTAYVFDFDVQSKGKSMKGLIQRGMSPEKVIKNEAAVIRRHQNMLQFKNEYCKGKLRCESMVDIPTYLTFNDKVSQPSLTPLILIKYLNILGDNCFTFSLLTDLNEIARFISEEH